MTSIEAVSCNGLCFVCYSGRRLWRFNSYLGNSLIRPTRGLTFDGGKCQSLFSVALLSEIFLKDLGFPLDKIRVLNLLDKRIGGKSCTFWASCANGQRLKSFKSLPKSGERFDLTILEM